MSRGPYRSKWDGKTEIITTKYALHNPVTGEWRNGSDILAYALDKSNTNWFVMEYDLRIGWQVVADPRRKRIAANA